MPLKKAAEKESKEKRSEIERNDESHDQAEHDAEDESKKEVEKKEKVPDDKKKKDNKKEKKARYKHKEKQSAERKDEESKGREIERNDESHDQAEHDAEDKSKKEVEKKEKVPEYKEKKDNKKEKKARYKVKKKQSKERKDEESKENSGQNGQDDKNLEQVQQFAEHNNEKVEDVKGNEKKEKVSAVKTTADKIRNKKKESKKKKTGNQDKKEKTEDETNEETKTQTEDGYHKKEGELARHSVIINIPEVKEQDVPDINKQDSHIIDMPEENDILKGRRESLKQIETFFSKLLKRVVGSKIPINEIITCLLVGYISGLIITILWYNYITTRELNTHQWALWSAAIIVFLMLARSSDIRCTLALAIPILTTSQGRSAIMAVAFLLTAIGPTANIFKNISIMGASLVCGQMELKQALSDMVDAVKKPLVAIKEAIQMAIRERHLIVINIRDSSDDPSAVHIDVDTEYCTVGVNKTKTEKRVHFS